MIKKTELSAYNDTLSAKQDELDDLVNDAGNAYSAKKGEVSAAQMSVEEYNAKIQEFRDNETALEGEAAAAQAALAQRILQQQQQQTAARGSLQVETAVMDPMQVMQEMWAIHRRFLRKILVARSLIRMLT